MGLVRFLILASFFGLAFFNTAYADRIKDMADVAGVRSNQLVGYGLVVGLAGTGDGNSGLTLQSMQAMVSRFGLVTDAAGLTATNVAAVMVTADLKPFVKPGQTLDITVSTLGASKSLRGGTLLMTPLLGADGETYAIAQGNLVVGGLGVAGADGSQLVVSTLSDLPDVMKATTVAATVSKNLSLYIQKGWSADFAPVSPSVCYNFSRV